MAIIRNPLFSIAASGTIGRILTIRSAETRTIASLPMRPNAQPSAAQQQCRLRGSWAATTWAGLTTAEQDQWKALALTRELPPFGLYMREFCAQRCTLTRKPQVPQ